jgi:hypothetical protein
MSYVPEGATGPIYMCVYIYIYIYIYICVCVCVCVYVCVCVCYTNDSNSISITPLRSIGGVEAGITYSKALPLYADLSPQHPLCRGSVGPLNTTNSAVYQLALFGHDSNLCSETSYRPANRGPSQFASVSPDKCHRSITM